MNLCALTNKEIGKGVDGVLRHRRWTVRCCCDKFNKLHGEDIKAGRLEKMNKDFVQRIRSNNFSVVNERVGALCEFLGIDLEESEREVCVLKDEMKIVEQAVLKNPRVEHKVKDLLRNIADIAGA